MQTFAHHRSRAPQRMWPTAPAPSGALKQTRALRHLLGRPVVQAKLRVSAPNDPLEAEADRTADAVMRMPAERAGIALAQTAPSVQRLCAACEDEVQAKRRGPDLVQRQDAEEEEDLVQTKSKEADGRKAAIAANVESGIGAGQSLPAPVRAFFEPRFGQSFDRVRIHTDTAAQESSEAINARAFTYGSDIVFGRGEYRPETPDGQRLIAHELAHTVQQGKSEPLVQREVREGRVSCRNPSARLQATVGADPVGTIRAADARAIAMIDTVLDTLEGSRDRIIGGAPIGWPAISDHVALSLQNRFGLDPNSEEVWTGRSARSVDVIIRRYRAARRLLSGGFLRYTCIGARNPPPDPCVGPGCGGETRAFTCGGVSRISLCGPWWSDSLDDQANTLVHEVLHIYFPHIGDTGHLANAHCYDQFLFDLNNLPVPALFQGAC